MPHIADVVLFNRVSKMGGFCWILPVLFFIVSQYAVVRQASSGTSFFSYASPSPPGVNRSSNFQSITSFKIPEKVECRTKLVSIIGSNLDEVIRL